ncbi:Major sperm protein [Aphelenchoides besseyi]|nr:Major sperm protein [Aphelenchoides besseyi]KAI6207473.1 Major sperm protein [Aphelenchoides besseyi]
MENTDFLLQLATVGVAMTGALATYIVQCGKNNKRGAVKKPAGSRSNKSLKTAKSKRSAKGGRWNNKSKRSARVSSRPSARSAKKRASSKRSKKSNREAGSKSSKRSKSSAITAIPQKAAQAVKDVKQTAEKKLNPNAVQEGGSQQKKDITAKMATEVHIAPQQLRFEPSGGRMRVFVHNPKKERYALKVKCSDNNTYRVSPVYAIVEPNAQALFDVYRQSAPSKVDKLVFVTSKVNDSNEDPKNAFKAPGHYSKIAMPLIA